eukprot:COSAG02_NODE_9146_length_2312_cov_3.665699_3_plen_138_part_00
MIEMQCHLCLATMRVRSQATPITVAGLSGVVQIEADRRSSYAMTSDGRLWSWGFSAGSQRCSDSYCSSVTFCESGCIPTPLPVAYGPDLAMRLHTSQYSNTLVVLLPDGTADDRPELGTDILQVAHTPGHTLVLRRE